MELDWGDLILDQNKMKMDEITIFCPPGPLPLRKASSISSSGGGFGRGGICFCFVLPEGQVVVNCRVWTGRRPGAAPRTEAGAAGRVKGQGRGRRTVWCAQAKRAEMPATARREVNDGVVMTLSVGCVVTEARRDVYNGGKQSGRVRSRLSMYLLPKGSST